jgi:hypothetical protein
MDMPSASDEGSLLILMTFCFPGILNYFFMEGFPYWKEQVPDIPRAAGR